MAPLWLLNLLHYVSLIAAVLVLGLLARHFVASIGNRLPRQGPKPEPRPETGPDGRGRIARHS